MRGTIRHRGLLTCALLGAALCGAFLTACGGSGDDGGQFANEATGAFPVEVISSEFKAVQTVAQTYDLTLAVRNSGDDTIPAINATINLPGLGSTLAFAYRDRQEGLAQAQRPIWVLEEGYPKLAGTVGRGGAGTANRRTFNFGELEPGDTANMVWRVTALKPGKYKLAWKVSAGLGTETSAELADGSQPAGVLPVRIGNRARLTRVDENGKVVPLSPSDQRKVEQEEASP